MTTLPVRHLERLHLMDGVAMPDTSLTVRYRGPTVPTSSQGRAAVPDEIARRDFLKYSTAAAVTAAGVVGAPAAAAASSPAAFSPTVSPLPPPVDPGPDRALDLVIRGGQLLDPSQPKRTGRHDVGIFAGRVAVIEPDLSSRKTRLVLDAAGYLVVPGLVDLHAHVYPQASGLGLPPDELAPLTATTTYVSAGDAGANNISGLRNWVAGQAHSRIFALLHISSIGLAGFPVGEALNADYLDVELAARTLADYPDFLLGMKVRESVNVVGNNGLEPLRRALRAAELSGTKARVMCHIGGAPGDLSQLLDLLRPGDILTHAYSGAGNNTVRDGRVLPAALAAKERGVIIDVGHGGGSFDFTVAEPAIAQGFGPTTISSDLHAVSGNTPGRPFLPWVMSKFLALGLPLEQVVALATSAPAGVIDRVPGLGTLQPGAPGDVSVLEVVKGPVTFVDTNGNERQGQRWLRPMHTVREGRPFGPPFPQPFTYP